LVYLFLPETFQWRVVQTHVQHRYVNLERLSDPEYAEICDAISRLDPYSSGKTHLVLKDFSEVSATISYQDLASNHTLLLPELDKYRSSRHELLDRWLETKPQVKFGLNMKIDANGIGMPNSKYWVTWNALEKYTLVSTQSASIFNFIPTKASRINQFGAGGIPAALTQAWLAEIDFWQTVYRWNAQPAGQLQEFEKS
jgi:hypothetical protein